MVVFTTHLFNQNLWKKSRGQNDRYQKKKKRCKIFLQVQVKNMGKCRRKGQEMKQKAKEKDGGWWMVDGGPHLI